MFHIEFKSSRALAALSWYSNLEPHFNLNLNFHLSRLPNESLKPLHQSHEPDRNRLYAIMSVCPASSQVFFLCRINDEGLGTNKPPSHAAVIVSLPSISTSYRCLEPGPRSLAGARWSYE
jgi:hypothetical protein